MFAKSGVIIETICEHITSACEKALLHFCKRTDDDSLDSLRHRMFCQKVASSQEVLPPKSAAAKYHSFLVFHQVRLWMSEKLSATE